MTKEDKQKEKDWEEYQKIDRGRKEFPERVARVAVITIVLIILYVLVNYLVSLL